MIGAFALDEVVAQGDVGAHYLRDRGRLDLPVGALMKATAVYSE